MRFLMIITSNSGAQMFARGPAVLKDINLDVKDDRCGASSISLCPPSRLPDVFCSSRWTPVAKRATAWTSGTFALVS